MEITSDGSCFRDNNYVSRKQFTVEIEGDVLNIIDEKGDAIISSNKYRMQNDGRVLALITTVDWGDMEDCYYKSSPDTRSAFQIFSNLLENDVNFLYRGIDPSSRTGFITLADNKDTYPSNINQFTIVDLDTDGTPEVVLEYSPMGDRLVLHLANGKVYGYMLGLRSMLEIKQDGTHNWSIVADDNGFGKIHYKTITYEQSALPLKANEFFAKKDVVWYKFSEESIKKDFATAWGAL
jgi:hypothetical protein